MRLATTHDLLDAQTDVPERPPIPWDRLMLTEEQAAELLKMPRQRFRTLAASGEFVRVAYSEKTFRYYAYDLLDWALAKRND